MFTMGNNFAFVLCLLGASGLSSSVQPEEMEPMSISKRFDPRPVISFDNETSTKFLNDSIVLQKGDNLVLRCRGLNPVEWIIEQEDQNIMGPDFQASKLLKINITYDSTAATLSGFQLEYTYTGNYICRYRTVRELSTSIYVFVSDEDNPFLKMPEFPYPIMIPLFQHQTAVLPCRTTNPSFLMSFQNHNHVDVDANSYKFDPKVGIIIPAVDNHFSGLFTCSSKRKRKLFIFNFIPQDECPDGYVKHKKSKGYYCEACPEGTYSGNNQTKCHSCPENSKTNGTARTSIDDCKCLPGFYAVRTDNYTKDNNNNKSDEKITVVCEEVRKNVDTHISNKASNIMHSFFLLLSLACFLLLNFISFTSYSSEEFVGWSLVCPPSIH